MAPEPMVGRYEQLLSDEVGRYYADPLGFVIGMFPWGEPGTPLERETGPDDWQAEFLLDVGRHVDEQGFDGQNPVKPLRSAVSSGHGIGKSVIVSWLVTWLMSTRPHCQGTITANTMNQLSTKTWAAVTRWMRLCRTAHWFEINSDRMYRIGHRESWFCAPASSKEENSEAFAGQHARDSTSFYIFDEASAIPDKIWEVAEGGMTDGEPMLLAFGNPTRTSGRFHAACFGTERHRWSPRIIDSRSSRFTNKQQIDEWISTYGEDSDFVRVRVRGLPPSASDLQFISTSDVAGAQRRLVEALDDEPLVVGLDVARGGSDECVFWFRLGPDARSIPPIIIPGEKARDSMKLVAVAADVLDRAHGPTRRKPDMLFVDGTGIGGPICDRLKQLGHKNVIEVQFAGESPDPKLANMRAYMWSRLREWLPHGSIPNTPTLETQITAPGYHHDKQDRVVLESKDAMKARGADSPDQADALALTFAMPVKARGMAGGRVKPRPVFGAYANSNTGWMQ
jgi:hypothetical protein